MKRFKIKSTLGFDFQLDAESIKDFYPNGNPLEWGKPERWVREGVEDVSKALESRDVITDVGTHKEFKLPAEYTIIEEDLTPVIAAEKARSDARKIKAKILTDLKGKSLSASEMKQFIEALRDLLLDPEANMAEILLKLKTTTN